jgi:hypothetical protein
MTQWLFEQKTKGIWLECHKDDIFDKLWKFNKELKEKEHSRCSIHNDDKNYNLYVISDVYIRWLSK